MYVDFCPTVLLDVSKGVPSGVCRYRMEERCSRDVHKAVCNTVHHCKFNVGEVASQGPLSSGRCCSFFL